MKTAPPYGITQRFRVAVDGIDLGGWKSCKGMNVSFKHKFHYEGGIYDGPAAVLPEHLEYQAITLERAMSATESPKVQKWLKDVSQLWMEDPTGGTYLGTTATITLLDATCTETVAVWGLRNVFPAKWSGPSLDAMGSASVALESLELVHQGFL
ncbi:phage tail protein [Streptomyces sp. NPDC126514]|uniref:phage tail protein n=1 Tax=Streptomyces sp. NPDC126514 TaxID=3155210 RepID=UPI00332AB0D4